MGDVTPNWPVERMKLTRQRMQLELNLYDYKIRLKEIEDEKVRTLTSIEGTEEAIKELSERLEGIVED